MVFSYFIYHSIQGDRGLLAWRHLNLRITEAKLTLAELEKQRTQLEKQVGMLSPSSLDPDLLEEQGRRLLNFSRKDEVVILLGAS
tara:strand:+ start:993 stop:1247 length:255 start_codon:yes stop_codon:yes gene_type:complete